VSGAGQFIFLLFVLGLASCGDSDDDEGGDAATDPTEAPASSDSSGEDGGATGDAVTIKDFSYEPEDLTVKSGATVTWTNDEAEPVHTVTTDDGATAEFDSDDLEGGGTFEYTFDEAGEYPYVCKIHASMSATVTVE